jgi:zinc/manganese transport system substrate-binding protein
MKRYVNPLLLRSALSLAVFAPGASVADEPLDVVATFSILGNMVEQVGGDQVAVTTLVGPNGDAHMYQPSPEDARAVSSADVLVVNGLEFEGWLDRLTDASDFSGVRIVAANGIDAIAYDDHGHDDGHEHEHGHDDHGHDDDHEHGHDHHDDEGHQHGAYDPHAWQSVGNALVYTDNISSGLSEADPNHAEFFASNADAYRGELESLDADIRALAQEIPSDSRLVVTSHDAFQYFGRDYGLEFRSPQGVSTESEASARDVADLIEGIRADGVSAVFFESTADTRLLERIAEETNARIGGTLFPGALSEPNGPAPSYLAMMRHNAETISAALAGNVKEDE